MQHAWAFALPFTTSRRPAHRPPDEPLPGIRPGAFAAWASAERRRDAVRIAAGDTCLMPDGRHGRVAEAHDDGSAVLVCRAF